MAIAAARPTGKSVGSKVQVFSTTAGRQSTVTPSPAPVKISSSVVFVLAIFLVVLYLES
jgi:hypothetical protein